jgi:hypothetical protein
MTAPRADSPCGTSVAGMQAPTRFLSGGYPVPTGPDGGVPRAGAEGDVEGGGRGLEVELPQQREGLRGALQAVHAGVFRFDGVVVVANRRLLSAALAAPSLSSRASAVTEAASANRPGSAQGTITVSAPATSAPATRAAAPSPVAQAHAAQVVSPALARSSRRCSGSVVTSYSSTARSRTRRCSSGRPDGNRPRAVPAGCTAAWREG